MIRTRVELNKDDVRRIHTRARNLEAALRAYDGPILKYLFKYVAEPYADAVISGMGKIDVGSIWDQSTFQSATLESFMGETPIVRWRPLTPYTVQQKAAQGMSLTMWMATGETVRAVKPVLKAYKNTFDIISGIRKSTDPEAYKHAIAAEYGGVNAKGEAWEGRALFTVLNEMFISHLPEIRDGVRKALAETIEDIGWGR